MIDLNKPLDYECLISDLMILTNNILGNANLCKLLYYNSKTPFQEKALTTEQLDDLFTKKNLIEITPRIEAREEQSTYLMLSFDYIEPTSTNPKFMDSVLVVDVISHIDLWKINNKKSNQITLRPYAIAHELHSILDGRKFTGIGTVNWIGTQSLILGVDSEYAGLTLKFNCVNSI